MRCQKTREHRSQQIHRLDRIELFIVLHRQTVDRVDQAEDDRRRKIRVESPIDLLALLALAQKPGEDIPQRLGAALQDLGDRRVALLADLDLEARRPAPLPR